MDVLKNFLNDPASHVFVCIYSYLGLFWMILMLTRSSQLYLTITCFVCIYN